MGNPLKVVPSVASRCSATPPPVGFAAAGRSVPSVASPHEASHAHDFVDDLVHHLVNHLVNHLAHDLVHDLVDGLVVSGRVGAARLLPGGAKRRRGGAERSEAEGTDCDDTRPPACLARPTADDSLTPPRPTP